ncbi:hypothetical protein EMCRGX_G023002 [Ephydatia muelleri]
MTLDYVNVQTSINLRSKKVRGSSSEILQGPARLESSLKAKHSSNEHTHFFDCCSDILRTRGERIILEFISFNGNINRLYHEVTVKIAAELEDPPPSNAPFSPM